MKTFDRDNRASIILFNAPTKDEAKRVRRKLLEEKLIRGGFIVPVESGYLAQDGEIIEDHDYFVVFAHTLNTFTKEALETIEKISDSFGMSWDLKEGTDDYAKWVFFSDQTLL